MTSTTIEARPRAVCPNCGAAAPGAYCPECGQAQSPGVPTVREWLRETVEDTFALDGRLARTLGLLCARPGALTAEWLAGRRERYTRPFRLYLLASLLFFTVSVLFPANTELRDVYDSILTGWTEGAADVHGGARAAERYAARDIFRHWTQILPTALLLLVPVLALGLKLLRPARRYLEHLVFSFHFHAFALLLLSLAWIAQAAWNPASVLLLASAPTSFLYLVLALRRAYGEAWLGSVLRSALLAPAYAAVTFVTTIVVAMVPVELEDRRALAAAAHAYDGVVAAEASGDSAALAAALAGALARHEALPARLVTPHYRYHQGYLYLLAGRPLQAWLLAEQVIEEDTGEPLALGLAAAAAERLGFEQQAAELYRRYRARPPVPPSNLGTATYRHAAEIRRYDEGAARSMPPEQ